MASFRDRSWSASTRAAGRWATRSAATISRCSTRPAANTASRSASANWSCAPYDSPEGQQYLAAVRCGINGAFANRQALAHLAREAFHQALRVRPDEITTLYEIAHNTAKVEEHEVERRSRKQVLVHRKGATRAFGPGRPELPAAYREVGQPVLVGGTMGTCSYICTAHKRRWTRPLAARCTAQDASSRASRPPSSSGARRSSRNWREQGILIRAHSRKGRRRRGAGRVQGRNRVVDIMHDAGIIRKVARVRPLICIKG